MPVGPLWPARWGQCVLRSEGTPPPPDAHRDAVSGLAAQALGDPWGHGRDPRACGLLTPCLLSWAPGLQTGPGGGGGEGGPLGPGLRRTENPSVKMLVASWNLL